MQKKPKAPKGVVSPKKIVRITGLRIALLKRNHQIQVGFNSTPIAKNLLRKIDTSANAAEKLLSERRNLKQSLINERKIKLAVSENATSNLLYFIGLKEFAVSKNVNHKFLKKLNELIDAAQDRVVWARDWIP